ncbi:TonB-dependent receptor [Ramlibacter sp. MAHUQ-53]|uniref:TonB-dependent receptor n=1 Tax=unclassified Ramlibacter TaxID=2617605 RepID=UPI00362728CF
MHSLSDHALLPLGALLLAASAGAAAQSAPATTPARTLATVEVKEKAEIAEGKDSVRATQSRIGRGTQELRDIPQSVTVVTERLMDDRNLDTVKDALRNTAGVSFMAAEGGEEDVRLRGFPVQGAGDMFIDGMRDPAIYDRDTFALDRLEVLRGSASMLFGRGSTGGAINQVTKLPRLMDENQVDYTIGSHRHHRVVGDFNRVTGENAALRVNVMATRADNNGSGSAIDKNGAAVAYRRGIGERDEFLASLYYLNNNNGVNYGMPWIRPGATSTVAQTTVLPVDPTARYGMATDYNHSGAAIASLGHVHRFDGGGELRTQARVSHFTRDLRASTLRLPGGTYLSNLTAASVLNRSTQLKIQEMDVTQLQSDYSGKFQALGLQHELLAGVDLALERKTVHAARAAAQGGVTIAKPTTLLGTPDDGAAIDESTRVLRTNNDYESTGYGAYVQDMVQVAEHWKVVAGLRWDHLSGKYRQFAIPANAAGPETVTPYRMKVSEFSKRLGALFQPNALQSYHVSLGTSFNTSGDAYSLSAANQDTPPEQSINFEVGGKFDAPGKQWTTRVAAFRTTKLHERNTDPLVNLTTLSGKRHVAGAEVDISGRITPKWEVFGSYMWLPIATIDAAVAGGETGRPSLTPRYSGTLWSTYQFTPKLRAGGGLNFRGEQTPNRNPGWTVPSFITADLMAEYVVTQDQLTVKANLSNLANKRYADQLYSGHYIPGAGRLLQVTTSFRF